MSDINLFNPQNQDFHYFMLAKHMPTGKLWEAVFDDNKTLGKLVKGLSIEYYRLSVLSKKIQIEMDINQTNELILEWERSVGIPDDCFSTNTSLEKRRLQVREKLSNFGGVQKAEDFERVAAVFGFDVVVSPGSTDSSLFPLAFPIVFFDSIKSAKHTIVVTPAVSGPGGDLFPLLFPIQFQSDFLSFLQCLFDVLAPANVQVVFDFTT